MLIWLAAIIAGGLALRLWRLRFGMPFLSNFYVGPDESLIVAAAARFLGKPRPSRLFFAYPALLVEICAVLFRVVGADSGSDPFRWFLSARVVSALCGALTIPVVWAIARRLTSERGALLAASQFACAPLPVRDAHFGVTDTLLTLLLAAAGLTAIRYLEAPPERTRLELWATSGARRAPCGRSGCLWNMVPAK